MLTPIYFGCLLSRINKRKKLFQIPFLLLAYWNVGTVVRMKRRQKHFQQLQRGGGMTNKTQQSSQPRALADNRPRDQQDEKETNKPKERGAVESGNDTRYKLIF